jgi:hypothetical protein
MELPWSWILVLERDLTVNLPRHLSFSELSFLLVSLAGHAMHFSDFKIHPEDCGMFYWIYG